ncbi:MAG: hypothetical protein H6698_04845 [Myxococcales bacterium]|nr:hypothetical protein [Myxococcales bacterium]MCB9533629.1 hypothetical protein [Myxococcales bacterium]
MTQPNYLQVQTALDGAVRYCAAHPDLSSSGVYADRLAAMRDAFDAATTQTDASYSRWRVVLGEELKALKAVKVEYDRTLELADEHGYDGLPKGQIVYTEPTQLQPIVEATIDWLSARSTEWPWMASRAAVLRSGLTTAATRKRDAEAAYTRYTVDVKGRVVAYDQAVALLREYIHDARRDAGHHHPYDGVVLDVL